MTVCNETSGVTDLLEEWLEGGATGTVTETQTESGGTATVLSVSWGTLLGLVFLVLLLRHFWEG